MRQLGPWEYSARSGPPLRGVVAAWNPKVPSNQVRGNPSVEHEHEGIPPKENRAGDGL